MRKIELDIPNEILVRDYLELKSSYKVAKKYNTSATAVKRILKDLGVLRTQKQAAQERKDSNFKGKTHTEVTKIKLSELASTRTGESNPFFGKTHSEETKKKLAKKAQQRAGKRNPNYKHGKTFRRPRDFQNAEMQKLKNFVFNRDKFTCKFCKKIGGHLHAHHIIPFWVEKNAFLDVDNLITVCTKCHFTEAHHSNWQCFNVELVTELLTKRYSLCRERLNELATFSQSRCDSLNSTNI
jgi:5-methylcytosine-specific restriction endonuclease McrA